MRRVLVGCVITAIALAAAIGVLGKGWAAGSEDTAVDYTKIVPSDLVKNTPKGKLVNPYKDTQADVVAQGQAFFRNYSCSGCHGGNGGGGMCPALTNDIWVYGGDDDTLFRLVTFGSVIKNADDLWKILAFVRSKYSGDPAYKFGAPADPPANP
jgi:mono/diheme cytochrome c family protein